MTELWISVTNFTSRENVSYYGHEIFTILNLATDLLNRQQSETNDTVESDELILEINSSSYATSTMNNLISNENQWNQLTNVCMISK